MAIEDQEYQPTYRQEDVDTTLNDHESRLNRLEKAVLVGIGYGLAEGYEIVGIISTFI